MATVFLAQDLKHDRPVALKLLHPELGASLGADRFEREIRLAARLQHPHILAVHDSGTVPATSDAPALLWFTMPFVEGETLRGRLVREKQLSLEEALRITRECADALDYAHRHGVVHRDVKPENILLSDAHALVSDFGIAKASGGSEERLTETGLAIGTPAYMSPEQASGERELDARSDIYALGCVLYEMLAGEPPFTGPTAQAIVAKALTESPRAIHGSRPAVPVAVDEVIGKAMARTPADRYPSAAQFSAALDLALRPAAPQATGTQDRVAATPARPRRFPVSVALGLGILIGLGVLFAWRKNQKEIPSAGPRILAVLPFENQGAPEDEYFADGMTDEVRGKLAALSGLEVIARGSSNPYKKTTETPQQIAQDLGAQYLLTATVRWEKSAGGTNKVHVSPELVEIRRGSAPTTRWQQSFDANLTDVFQVQGDIAGRVAQALNLALGDSARQQLAERPTENVAAHDAFLRGEEASQSMGVIDPPSLRRAAAYYGQAVALDSGFAGAWAQLSRTHTLLYILSTPSPDEAEQARSAAERAVALAPNRAEGHLARGDYLSGVLADRAAALTEYAQGEQLAPANPDLLVQAALAEEALGRWESALAHLQQAQRLDPRSVNTVRRLGYALINLRRYPEAEEAIDRGLVLSPINLALIENKTMLPLMQGDLAGARAVIAAGSQKVDPAALVAFLAVYGDLCWPLDDAHQALLLSLTPSAFDNDRANWGIVKAQTYWLRGDEVKTRAYADSALAGFDANLRATPNDAQQQVLRGLALAYLGRKREAVEEGLRATTAVPMSKDAFSGPYYQHQLVRIYILVGEPEKALDQLEPLLRVPYFLSPAWLRIDPNFVPLKGNPRFERLIAGK
jgi:serine/threonine-protein kinase